MESALSNVVVTRFWVQEDVVLVQVLDEAGEPILVTGPVALLRSLREQMRAIRDRSGPLTLDERWQVISGARDGIRPA
jgi:hypothetical protein